MVSCSIIQLESHQLALSSEEVSLNLGPRVPVSDCRHRDTENNVCSHPVFLFPGKPGKSDKETDIDTDIEVAQSCLTL